MKASSRGLSSAQYLILRALERLSFHDTFNRGALDTDIWTETLDGTGAINLIGSADYPTHVTLTSGNLTDNDSAMTGDAIYGKAFTPFEVGYTTVEFETRIRFGSVANISALLGIFSVLPTSYTEPNTDCLQFLMDPLITNTFRARTYNGAEEETDTLIALDLNWHRLKIVWTRTAVTFYLDDVLVATHVTRVPDQHGRIALLLRTEADLAKGMMIDYVDCKVS